MDEGLSVTNRRGSAGTVGGTRGYEDKCEVPSEPEASDEPMKTMAELAAEHAERQRDLGIGSTRSKLSGRGVRSSRARQEAVDDEGEDEPEDEDLSEPSLSDHLSDSPALSKKHKTTSSTTPSRTNTRSSSKSTPKHRKKRARSPDLDEGSDTEYGGSSRSKSTSTRPRPKRKGAVATVRPTPGASRTVSGSNPTSTAVPASDRVLRSRKARV